jgi:hypothetical protein
MYFSTDDSTNKSSGLDITLFNKLKVAKIAKHEQLLSEITAIEDLAEKIDTSLTKEEQEHVNKLKKILKGAAGKPCKQQTDFSIQYNHKGNLFRFEYFTLPLTSYIPRCSKATRNSRSFQLRTKCSQEC